MDQDLRDLVGQAFVEHVFTEEDKQYASRIMGEEETTFKAVFEEADWLSPSTRTVALTKINNIVNRIGYPERWDGYETVALTRASWQITFWAPVNMS
jgi:putative endopeptidase